jgi:hypothetical protein
MLGGYLKKNDHGKMLVTNYFPYSRYPFLHYHRIEIKKAQSVLLQMEVSACAFTSFRAIDMPKVVRRYYSYKKIKLTLFDLPNISV